MPITIGVRRHGKGAKERETADKIFKAKKEAAEKAKAGKSGEYFLKK